VPVTTSAEAGWGRGLLEPSKVRLAPRAAPIQPRRPIPALSRINAIRFDGKSIYHGVTCRVERRLADDFAYNVSYTLSESRDDASSPGATEAEANVPQNVRNIFGDGGEWAHSSLDHRHQFIASGVYNFSAFAGRGGLTEACWATGARIRSSSSSRARHSPSTSVSTARTSGPGPPSGRTR
jgi:hypothetical protein